MSQNNSLNQSRGIAAVMVAVGHSLMAFNPTGIPIEYQPIYSLEGWDLVQRLLMATMGNGQYAVIYFFLLSGFVLAKSSVSQTLPEFLWRRFWRLYPANFAVLLLLATCLPPVATAAGLTPQFLSWWRPVTWEAFWMNATLMSNPVNGVTWSLYYEVVAALWMLPAIRLIGHRPSLAWWLLPILMALDVAKAPIFNIFTYAWVFYLGALLAHTQLPRVPLWAAFPFMLAGGMIMAFCPDITDNTNIHLVRFIQVLGAVFALAWLTQQPQLGGRMGVILSRLGRATYTFYLLHPLIWLWSAFLVGPFLPGMNHHLFSSAVLAAISISATYPLSLLGYHAVERPGLWVGRKNPIFWRKARTFTTVTPA